MKCLLIRNFNWENFILLVFYVNFLNDSLFLINCIFKLNLFILNWIILYLIDIDYLFLKLLLICYIYVSKWYEIIYINYGVL